MSNVIRRVLTLFVSSLFLGLSTFAESSSNWPRWRGPGDNGAASGSSYPATWDATHNILWQAALPGKGCSTPIVWNQRIYVTAPVGGNDALVVFDWAGHELARTPLGAERVGKHVNGSGANPSPATDGSAVFASFKSGRIAALELDGAVRWKSNMFERFGKDNLYWDYGISPVLTEKDVIFALMHHGESYLAALDKKTGEIHWKVARNYTTPIEGDHSYATPLLIHQEGREALLVLGGEHLTAHDAADGSVIWSCGDFNPKALKNWVPVASPVVSGDIAVVPYGRGARLHGIKLGGHGDVTATHRLWVRQDIGSFVPSPVEFDGRIYLLRDHGELACIDPQTGKTLFEGALPKSKWNYYASPALADGKLYAAREDGAVYVVNAKEKFELLGSNDMGERVIASPVPIAGRLLIRGEEHLFCIGQAEQR